MTDRPGYQKRRNKDGTTAHYWNPKRAVTGAPAHLGLKRLDDDITDEQIDAECQRLTAQLREEIDQVDAPLTYDGTIRSLIALYRADETSTLHGVKFATKIRDYEPSLRVLEKNVGDRVIDKLRASDFTRWFAGWKKKGHRRATGAIKLLRLILSYGAGERMGGCAQARAILSDMRFQQPAARTVVMTYDQCLAIVKAAAELECPSIGFVEALKFETALRRIDVIGEWVPNEGGGRFRWQGLTVGSISKDKILSLTTGKTGAHLSRDLNTLPLVQEALKHYAIPEIGPVVIDENTGKPYRENHYAKKFQKVRKKAGVPKEVWSMDARAGAITETIAATGSLENAQNLATHSSPKMTRRYARGDGLEESRRIAEARAALRPVKRG